MSSYPKNDMENLSLEIYSQPIDWFASVVDEASGETFIKRCDELRQKVQLGLRDLDVNMDHLQKYLCWTMLQKKKTGATTMEEDDILSVIEAHSRMRWMLKKIDDDCKSIREKMEKAIGYGNLKALEDEEYSAAIQPTSDVEKDVVTKKKKIAPTPAVNVTKRRFKKMLYAPGANTPNVETTPSTLLPTPSTKGLVKKMLFTPGANTSIFSNLETTPPVTPVPTSNSYSTSQVPVVTLNDSSLEEIIEESTPSDSQVVQIAEELEQEEEEKRKRQEAEEEEKRKRKRQESVEEEEEEKRKRKRREGGSRREQLIYASISKPFQKRSNKSAQPKSPFEFTTDDDDFKSK